eukprot:5967195-Alexandrium_andersonii.AAC.1
MPPPVEGPRAQRPLPWAPLRQCPAPADGGRPAMPQRASGRPRPRRPWPGGTGRPRTSRAEPSWPRRP